MFTESMDDFLDTDEHAETVSYTAVGEDAADITAIVNDDFPRQEDYDRGVRFAMATLEVHNSQVATPKAGDLYTFHGHTWELSSDGYQRSGDFYTVNLVRLLT